MTIRDLATKFSLGSDNIWLDWQELPSNILQDELSVYNLHANHFAPLQDEWFALTRETYKRTCMHPSCLNNGVLVVGC